MKQQPEHKTRGSNWKNTTRDFEQKTKGQKKKKEGLTNQEQKSSKTLQKIVVFQTSPADFSTKPFLQKTPRCPFCFFLVFFLFKHWFLLLSHKSQITAEKLWFQRLFCFIVLFKLWKISAHNSCPIRVPPPPQKKKRAQKRAFFKGQIPFQK